MNKDENLKTISKLLDDFGSFIENRSVTFLVYLSGVLPKILSWHFLNWQKETEYLSEEDKISLFMHYDEITRTLDYFLKTIEIRALHVRASLPFFKYFKKHLENNRNSYVEIDGDRRYYLEHLLSLFYGVFFENINKSPEKHEIWNEYFSSDWKITKANLANPNNYVSRISFQNFYIWCGDRIRQAEGEPDTELEEINLNLFPEVEPTIWAAILIFILSGYANTRLIVEKPWIFGHRRRVRFFPGIIEGDGEKFKRAIGETKQLEEIERKKTFELAFYLFKTEFSKENLENYIKELEEFKFGKESPEERKRLQLLDVFKSMQEFVSMN